MSHISQPELDQFEHSLEQYGRGELDFEEFRKVRVWQGVYTLRAGAEAKLYMVRVKIPQGRITSAQMEKVADLAEKFSRDKLVHITTRQGMELFGVEEKYLMEVLRSLAEVDLTTRETGGNGVRNVTACPFSGVAQDEVFDVTPYARAFTQYFLRHPISQNLPRKVKVGFEGCRSGDHIRAMVQDIGFFAVVQGGQRGFQVYVGGGLGGAPREAQRLEEFTPAEELLATGEAIIAVFDRHGGRQNRDRARLKYLIQDWGIKKFQAEVAAARNPIIKEGRKWPALEDPEEAPRAPADPPAEKTAKVDESGWLRWLAYNIVAQKQSKYYAVFIRCPLGDITAEQLRVAARAAKNYCGGRVRTTITQNLLLRWVPRDVLVDLYRDLGAVGLTRCCAEHVMDITRCAGSSTCLSAMTNSRGMALELGKIFSNGLSHDPEIFNLVVKVSGCPHACGQHHIADLGLHGTIKTASGRAVPHYQILLGGGTERGKARFAKPVLPVPAKKIPEAVSHLLKFYQSRRQSGESLKNFVDRAGVERVREELTSFTPIPPYEQDPEIYKDWGSDRDFQLQAKKGECSA